MPISFWTQRVIFSALEQGVDASDKFVREGSHDASVVPTSSALGSVVGGQLGIPVPSGLRGQVEVFLEQAIAALGDVMTCIVWADSGLRHSGDQAAVARIGSRVAETIDG